MTFPWQDRQTLDAAAAAARDIREVPINDVAMRLYQLDPERLVSLTMTLAAFVDPEAPFELVGWEHAMNRPPVPPRCSRGIAGHRRFRLEGGRNWRCRDCDVARKRRARKAAAIERWRVAS